MEEHTVSAAGSLCFPAKSQCVPPPIASAPAGAPREGADPTPFSYTTHKRPGAVIAFFSKGVQLTAPKPPIPHKLVGGGKRAIVTGWSAASRARLRDTLLKIEPPAGYVVADITLTVPGDVVGPDEWRRIFHQFSKRVASSGCSMVWRVELQQRGQPHIHATIYGPTVDLLKDVAFEVWPDCVRLLGPYEYVFKNGGCVACDSRMWTPGAHEHAAQIKFDDGSAGWWRYLCNHTSKLKQAQMGWQGRQWGVVGRGRLPRKQSDGSVELNSFEYWRLRKLISRMVAGRPYLKDGKWIKPRPSQWFLRSGTTSLFSSPLTVARLTVFVKGGVTVRRSDGTVLQSDGTVYTLPARAKRFVMPPPPKPLSAESQRAVDRVRLAFDDVGP